MLAFLAALALQAAAPPPAPPAAIEAPDAAAEQAVRAAPTPFSPRATKGATTTPGRC